MWGKKYARLVAEIRRYINRMIAAVQHILGEAERIADNIMLLAA